MKSRKKSKDTLRQIKQEHNYQKTTEHSYKREIPSDTGLKNNQKVKKKKNLTLYLKKLKKE